MTTPDPGAPDPAVLAAAVLAAVQLLRADGAAPRATLPLPAAIPTADHPGVRCARCGADLEASDWPTYAAHITANHGDLATRWAGATDWPVPPVAYLRTA